MGLICYLVFFSFIKHSLSFYINSLFPVFFYFLFFVERKQTKANRHECKAIRIQTGVNFINLFHAHFLYESGFCCQNVTREKHFRTKNVLVKGWWNWQLVSISSTFYARFFHSKIHSKPNSKQRKNFCTKNEHVKCWWKWQLNVKPREGKMLEFLRCLKKSKKTFVCWNWKSKAKFFFVPGM